MDGQLCYQADVERFRDKVEDKKKVVTEGLVFWLDYNENRMVESVRNIGMDEDSSLLGKKEQHEDAMIYVETVGR